MKLQHKKLFKELEDKYNLTYWKGEGGLYPTNYHNFNYKDELYLQIELIPEGKYLYTAYCMFTGIELPDIKEVYQFIVDNYTAQKINRGFVVDNNAQLETVIL